MSNFFIRRPNFAWVIAIMIMLGGLLALNTLSVSQYPDIAPTTVRINASYSGADATTVENSVTKIIEQAMTGLDNLDYMTSSSTSSGSSSITLTFNNEADPDVAQMEVQNKLQLVTSQLPDAVVNSGISVNKSSSSFLMIVGFVSTDGRMSAEDLSDYVDSTLNDTFKRIDGVGGTQLFGSSHAMRIWLDPEKLAKYQLMPSDVSSAVSAQNTQVSAGQLGAQPSVAGQQLNVTVTAASQLQTADQFRNIVLKSTTDGSVVRLNDVATVEIGAENYNFTSGYNGLPTAGLAINLANGANAISTSNAVKAAVARLSSTLPAGVEVVYPYDTTPFVELSIHEVVKTLIEAVVLVFIVMLVFLQSFRATLIPTLAVPVVLLGTFGVLSIFGYSINTLTMFAMVLAIGLLVDDAIVVVENVERVMREEGLAPRQATIKSMGEITGALIGIALVLTAVFIPMAFFGGSVGVIYRQFSVTIVSAMLLSVLVALILTPALCATILKPPKHHAATRGPFGWFNRLYDASANGYFRANAGILKRSFRFFVLFLVLVGLMGFMFNKLPSSFLPEEDQGILMVSATLPVGATKDRTERVLKQVTDHFMNDEKDAVEGTMTIIGFGFGGTGQNVGMVFVRLKDFDQRTDPSLSAQAVAGRAMGAFAKIKDAKVFAMAPPAVPGLGNSSGFDFYLQDVNGAGHDKLMQVRNQFLQLAGESPLLSGTRPNGQEDTPQLKVEIDRDKASALGVSLSDINDTLSAAWGGQYIDDFNDNGRIKSVYMQSAPDFRMQPEDLDKWRVRNDDGDMVPFSSFSSMRWTYGSPNLQRFNGSSAVEIQGGTADGVSSGEAMAEVARIVGELPPGYSYAWAGLSYQEELSGNQAGALYAISVLVVFLCLVALYESWSIPFAVMLSVPIGVLGALGAALLFGQTNDVYFKVGLLTTIGLATKNAILIVEFAILRQEHGEGLIEATLNAAKTRLRPILMTSFAFILGVLPLAIATGAGSGARNSIGIGVTGGMLAATVLGIFFVPLLFVLVSKVFRRKAGQAEKPQDDGAGDAASGPSPQA
ncbi:efflux RND transporter permease subunit [Martelella sp. HB161492]|uniref:efflux RND transporter permease subunit n=1 Tax=Martelella sp. HB161492 TaxID=2720726 RepID=UPI0015921BB2|nr:efflux RND transporter permease subunit [Martelella sp. HB161492]